MSAIALDDALARELDAKGREWVGLVGFAVGPHILPLLSFMSDATYLAWKSPLEIRPGLGVQAEWIALSGLTTDANTRARELSGLVLFVRAGVSAALQVAPSVWLDAGACIGLPLREVEATSRSSSEPRTPRVRASP